MASATTAAPAIPVIQTERLILRGYSADDLDDVYALLSDPEVMRYLGGVSLSREDAWRKLLGHVGHWSLLGFGFWVAVDRVSGRFVGSVGLAHFNRGVNAAFDGAPEIGWVLATWAHGRGLATEAARAAVAWGEQRFGWSKTVCLIHSGHAQSLEVAAKCGYRETERTVYKETPVVLLERTAAR